MTVGDEKQQFASLHDTAPHKKQEPGKVSDFEFQRMIADLQAARPAWTETERAAFVLRVKGGKR